MVQTKKPSATAIAEGFDELNSTFDATEFTTIRNVCALRIKPSQSFVSIADSSVMAHSFPNSPKGGR
jgi:hypothetical protein